MAELVVIITDVGYGREVIHMSAKIKYEKPSAVSLGNVAPIMGASCYTLGNGATDGCAFGQDPSYVPFCPNGSVATDDCVSVGGVAGSNCRPGNTAANYVCEAGGVAKYHGSPALR
jgi:hypothetical protein